MDQTEIKERKDGKWCRVCGEVPVIPPEPVAVLIGIEACDGTTITLPAVICACVKCRRAIGTAERMSKGPPGGQ